MADAKTITAKLKLDGKEFKQNIGDSGAAVLKFTATVTAVSAAVAAAAVMTAKYRDETTKAARAAGSSVEDFSALRHAADLSGISMDNLAKGLRKITEPTALVSKEMERIGVSLRDVNGDARDQSDILLDLSDKYSKMETPAERAGSAMLIFGERGAEMVNLLGGGSEALREMMTEAQRMGLAFDERAGKSAELFNDNITRVTGSVKGLVQQVSGSIIELVNQTGVMEALASAIQTVTGLWMGLDDETKEMVTTIGGVVAGIAALTLAVVAFAGLAPMIGAAITTMTGGLNLVVVAIAAAVIAFTALAVAAVKYWDQIKEAVQPAIDTITEFGNSIRDALKPLTETFAGAIAAVNGFITDIVDKFKEWMGITDDASTKISILGTVAKTVFAVISTAVIVIITPFKILFTLISNIVKALQAMGEAAVQALKGNFEAAQKIAAAQQARLSKMAETIKNDFVGAGEKIKETFKNLTVTIDPTEAIKNVDMIKNAVSGIQDASKKTSKKATDEFKKMTQAISGAVSQATGAINQILGASISMIEDASKKAVSSMNRQFEFFSTKLSEAKDREIALVEEKEKEKIDALNNLYDKELENLKSHESAKVAAIQNASNERLLALDEEYQAAAELQEEEFERFMEQEEIRFEAEKEAMLEKAIDKEQRMLVEAIMDQDFKNHMANQQKFQDDKMNALAKDFASKQKAENDQSKADQVTTETTTNEKIEELTEQKNTAIATSEEEKNKKLEKLEKEKFKQEKLMKKMELLMNWRAEKSQLEQTKAMKITQTIVTGVAGAAGAMAMAAGTIPIVGAIIGAVLMAAVLATTFASVAQIATQTVPPPMGLFLQGGGVLSGPRHSQGGIPSTLEGGEGVLDRARTQKFMDSIDSQVEGSGGVNIIFEAGAIQNSGDPMDESFIDRISYAIARRFERHGVTA